MHRAAELRKEMTAAEKRLWAALRESRPCGVSFRRSHAIGLYIADFCAPGAKLVIELDGEPHRGQQQADAERTESLEAPGYTVIRFWNSQIIEDLPNVLLTIERALKDKQQPSERPAYPAYSPGAGALNRSAESATLCASLDVVLRKGRHPDSERRPISKRCLTGAKNR